LKNINKNIVFARILTFLAVLSLFTAESTASVLQSFFEAEHSCSCEPEELNDLNNTLSCNKNCCINTSPGNIKIVINVSSVKNNPDRNSVICKIPHFMKIYSSEEILLISAIPFSQADKIYLFVSSLRI
jgi:hypothetical protein